MSEEKVDGSGWLRDERRRKADPEDRRAGRAQLMNRLFGTDPDTEDKPDNGPDAAK